MELFLLYFKLHSLFYSGCSSGCCCSIEYKTMKITPSAKNKKQKVVVFILYYLLYFVGWSEKSLQVKKHK